MEIDPLPIQITSDDDTVVVWHMDSHALDFLIGIVPAHDLFHDELVRAQTRISASQLQAKIEAAKAGK